MSVPITTMQYQKQILNHLTPDDLRTLMIAEDELARAAPLERIFPSPTSHKYLQFLEHPRYHNRLLDAWEHRYGGGGQKRRDEGIALLRRLAADRMHLIVPPPPAKKVSTNVSVAVCLFSFVWVALRGGFADVVVIVADTSGGHHSSHCRASLCLTLSPPTFCRISIYIINRTVSIS